MCRSCETKSAEFVFIVRRPYNAGDVCRQIFAAMISKPDIVSFFSAV